MRLLDVPLEPLHQSDKVLQHWSSAVVAFVFKAAYVLVVHSKFITVMLEPGGPVNEASAHGISCALYVFALLCRKINTVKPPVKF